jgi:hypothetical protein
MLTGRKPWSGQTTLAVALERFKSAPPRPSDFEPGLSAEWDDLVGRCLARQPEKRYAAVDQIRPPAGTRRRLFRRRTRNALGAAAAVALLLGGAGWGLWRARRAGGADGNEPVPVDAGRLAAILASRPPGAPPARPPERVFVATGCSDDMVAVGDRFCIDRFEAATVDDVAERPLSPFYPPWAPLARSVRAYRQGRAEHLASPLDRTLLALPAFQLEDSWRPRAISRVNVTPQAYVSRPMAAAACASAGKRLCTADEWKRACRGEKNTRFPYGDEARDGLCNAASVVNPTNVDPDSVTGPPDNIRLRTHTGGLYDREVLHKTGDAWGCRSRWGGDAIYDMVGNLNEWVDGPGASYLGGYYTHDSGTGCEARAEHAGSEGAGYFHHSLGFRCCDQLRPPPAASGMAPAAVVAEVGATHAAGAEFDGFRSASAVATDVFAGRAVLFRGKDLGGSRVQLPAGAYLVYRFRLTYPRPVQISRISIHGAGAQERDESQVRLLDDAGRVLDSRKTAGFKVVGTTSLRPTRATGSVFLLEEWDAAGRYRYRDRIEVIAEPLP